MKLEPAQRPPSWRLFVAITPPHELRTPLLQARGLLRRRLPPQSVKWMEPDQMHLTLRFLGDVPVAEVDDVLRAVTRVAAGMQPFDLTLEGLGAFPPDRVPRVLWVGMSGALDALAALHAAMLAATAPWGVREERPFHGHLTLGRVRDLRGDDARAFCAAWSDCALERVGRWRVTTAELFRSVLTKEGAIHTRLE